MSQPSASAGQLPLLKLLLHAAKFPSAAVNGALLGKIDNVSGAVHITDVVPLFHTALSLAPPVEIALSQLDAHVTSPSSEVQLVGYYHSEARHAAADLPPVGRRIADRIAEHVPGAVVLLLDSKKLASYVNDAEQLGPLDLFARWDGSKGWKREAVGTLGIEGGSQGWKDLRAAFFAAFRAQLHRLIADFDEHLDDVAKDYFNTSFTLASVPGGKFALPGQLA